MVIVPPDRDPDGSPFSPAERAIFAYDLGPGRPAYHGDPLAIEDRYEAALAGVDAEVLRVWLDRKNPSVRLRGYRRLLPIVRAGFGLPPFAESTPAGLAAGEALPLLARFHAYQATIRARWRREAEFVATYGHLPGRPHSYEREVGLVWNRHRVQALAGVAHWRGALAAFTHGPVHPALVDAMAPNEAAAAELARRIDDDRRQAEAQAKHGRR